MDEGYGGLRSEGRAEAGDVPEMKEGGLGNVFNVVFEGEGLVKDDAKVGEVGGRGDCVTVNGEGEVVA